MAGADSDTIRVGSEGRKEAHVVVGGATTHRASG